MDDANGFDRTRFHCTADSQSNDNIRCEKHWNAGMKLLMRMEVETVRGTLFRMFPREVCSETQLTLISPRRSCKWSQ